jgi:hypothetical protein
MLPVTCAATGFGLSLAGFGFYYIVPGMYTAEALAQLPAGKHLRTLLDLDVDVCHKPLRVPGLHASRWTDGDLEVCSALATSPPSKYLAGSAYACRSFLNFLLWISNV